MVIERQHYVSQGYLKGFSALDKESDKFIWVYEKLPNRKPRCVSVKSIAWSPFYYEQEKENGERDTDTLEKTFAETIDSIIPDIIQSISAKANSTVSLSEEDRGKLSFFIGISLTRVPDFRDGTRAIYTKRAQHLLEVAGEKDAFIAEGIKKYGPIVAEAKEWVSLEPMIKVATEIGNSVLAKKWQFFIPPKNYSLITSDNPVHFSISKDSGITMAGPGHPMAEVTIHLRSDLALVCTPLNCGVTYPVFELSKQEAKKFNRGVARAAGRFVFSNQYLDGIEKLTRKYTNEKQSIEL